MPNATINAEHKARIERKVRDSLQGELVLIEHVRDYETGEHRYVVLSVRTYRRPEWITHFVQINREDVALIWGHYFTDFTGRPAGEAEGRARADFLARVKQERG